MKFRVKEGHILDPLLFTTFSGSIYDNDTTVLFTEGESLESSLPLLLDHYSKFGLNSLELVHQKNPQDWNFCLFAIPNRTHTQIQKRMTTNIAKVVLGVWIVLFMWDRCSHGSKRQ